MSDYSPGHYRQERGIANEQSKVHAVNDGKPWTDDDDMVLVDRWLLRSPGNRDYAGIARDLGRTIEACRVRCEKLRKVLGMTEITRTTTTTTTYRHVEWPDDDYNHDWYVQ